MADSSRKEGEEGDNPSSLGRRTASEQTSNMEQPSQDATREAPRGVRFSEDLDRATALSSLPSFTNSSQRPGTPNLTIDTNASRSVPRKSVDAPRPAAGILSNRSGAAKGPPSPLSPRTRDRGYSLRRTLFARSIDDRRGSGSASEGESPIELERVEAGSSSQRQGIQFETQDENARRLEEGKGKTGPTVAVSPVIEDELEISVFDSREQPQSVSFGKAKEKKSFGTVNLPNYATFAKRRTQSNAFLTKINAWRKKVIKDFQERNRIPPSKDGRHIDLDAARKTPLIDERTGIAYVGNMIRSSRYTIYNFVPRQLFFQFSKLANAYFLLVSVLQMVPGLSTTGNYTTIAPLLVFVAISMGKEGYDDVRRYKLDQVENNRETLVLHAYRQVEATPDEASFAGKKGFGRWLSSKSSSIRFTASRPTGDVLSVEGPRHWATLKWKDVKVGDIIKLQRDDPVPADIVLMHADGANDIAYIETMALDGETNLKSKQPPVSLAKRCTSEDAIAACHAQVIVEDPNLDLYNFDGRVTVDGETLPLTTNEVVFRGSTLRNTKTAIGMVINTGEECKIRMNANKNPRIKSPAIQVISNKIIVCLVIFVILLSLFCTIAYQIWASSTESKSWYLDSSHVPFSQIIIGFVILYNTLIPLSLYVSLEIIKVGQLLLMNDIEMYDPISNTPMICNTTTILENLGQVDYIFSDKTGTLTENVMRFRKLSVAGYAWLHDFDLQKEAAELEAKKEEPDKLKHKGKGKAILRGSMKKKPRLARNESDLSAATVESNDFPRRSGSVSLWKSSARPTKQQPEMRTEDLLKFMQHKPHSVFTKKAKFFLLSLALCHTCLPEVQENGEIDFQAASPDELALVKAAQELGYLVIDRAARSITLTYPGITDSSENITETYDILDVIEFSSKRKRMSIIVRFPNGRICIFCKGADSTLVPRLKMAPLAIQKKTEIIRRSSIRKSIEAEQALRRMSEHSPRASFSRPSMNLSRPSISRSRKSINHNRSSVGGQSLQPIRDELDSWLRRREHDVEAPSDEEEVNAYRSPRHSMARTSRSMNRMSYASSGRGSMGERDEEEEEDWDEMVDEAVVLDEAMVFERCFQHIDDFATEGLRTLLFGYRFLDEDEYNGWKKVYLDATTSLVNRQTLIEQAGEMIEQNFDLAGATAIEDKLQKGVPETIDKLRRANIKIWMLTGDKRETAINIAHSARICKNYSEVVILDHTTGEVEQRMATTLLDISKGSIAHSVVVVDGQTLSEIDSNETLKLLFFDLAVVADSVICCRASPSQKASLVKKIRTKVNKSITLAIGDGANDIAMILEANVGIGISGKEGLQAARISDYSIAQFRFLQRLLLVHGRWNYVRTGKYILSTFWKELLFYLMQALYQRWTGYTGTSLFESTSLTVFNTLFTSLPVIFLGIFEQDLNASTLLAVPELYVQGQRNEGFNIRLYLSWMVMAVSESVMIYFCMFGLFGEALFTQDDGLLSMGTICFTAAVIFINTKMLVLEFHNKTIVPLVGFILSIGGWFLWQIVLSLLYKPGKSYLLYPIKDGFVYYFGRNLLWWLVLILSLASVIVLELGVKSLKKSFWPSDTDLFQQLQKDPVIKKRFEDSMNAEDRPGSSGTAIQSDGSKEKTSTDVQGEREIQELLSRPRIMPIGMDGADAEVVRSPVEAVDLGNVQRTASGNHLTRRKISMDHGNDGHEAATGDLSPRKSSNVTTRHSVDIAEVLRRRA